MVVDRQASDPGSLVCLSTTMFSCTCLDVCMHVHVHVYNYVYRCLEEMTVMMKSCLQQECPLDRLVHGLRTVP